MTSSYSPFRLAGPASAHDRLGPTTRPGRFRGLRDAVGGRLPLKWATLLAPNRLIAAGRAAPHQAPSLRFALREGLAPLVVGHRSTTRRYRRPSSGLSFFFRHGTVDIGILSEIFELNAYELPPEAAQRLEGSADLTILDLGGHIGLFGIAILERFPNAHVVAYEPDDANFALLRTCIASNPSVDWVAHQACASNADGLVRFASGRSSGSTVIGADDEEPFTWLSAVDVLPDLASADLVKIDIEGSEWSILRDPRFSQARVPVVVLEYHPNLCPSEDPRTYLAALLGEMGYVVRDIFHDDVARVGMVWATLGEDT